jgi:hypothetical protein
MPDYGLPAGLAYRHDYNRTMDNDKYLHALGKQAAIDKENKAKMMVDDIQFGKANNRWDHQELKGYSENEIKELGKFYATHPDWASDPNALLQIKQRKNNLLNNPLVERAMRVDTHYANMMKYLSDPKNSHMRNDPIIAEQLKQYENYSNTGSADGNGVNGIEFAFIAPEEAVDTEEMIQKYASSAEYDLIGGGVGIGGYSQSVSSKNRSKVATSVLSNANIGKYLQSDWNRLGEEGQKQYRNINNYVLQRMDPYFKEKKIVNGAIFKPDASGLGGGEGVNPWKKDVVDPLLAAFDKGKTSERVTINQGLTQEVITDHKGNVDMRDAEIRVPGSNDYVSVNLGNRKAQTTGTVGMKVGADKKAYLVAEATIDFKPEEFEEVMGSDAIDAQGLNNLPFTDYDEFNDFQIKKDFQGTYEKIMGEDGKPMIRATVDVPFRNVTATSGMYNKFIGAKSMEYDSNNTQQTNVYQDAKGQYVIQAGQKVYGNYIQQ